LNVLLVGNYLSTPKHNLNVWQDLAFHLEKVGFEVATTSSKTNKVARLIDMLLNIWLLRRNYQAAQVDVFSGQAFLWAECCGKLLHALGKPFILTLHGGNLPAFSQKHSPKVKQILGMANVVTAPSNYLLHQMAQYRPDILLIPNPIEISNYSFRVRISPTPSLIWLRAFHRVYNPVMAPKVLSHLFPAFPETRLTMIGPDKGDHTLQATIECAQALGVTHMMSLPGSVSKSEVPGVLNKNDIFINTTNSDNAPTSLIEAMACGLCVVSTNVGGIPYLINHNVDGILVPPDDPMAMANAIQRILSEPGLAEKLSLNGRKKAEQLDWSIVLPQWEKLFNGLV